MSTPSLFFAPQNFLAANALPQNFCFIQQTQYLNDCLDIYLADVPIELLILR